MHILVSLADSCSSLVQTSHRDIHTSTCSESTGQQQGCLPESSEPRLRRGCPLPTSHQSPSVCGGGVSKTKHWPWPFPTTNSWFGAVVPYLNSSTLSLHLQAVETPQRTTAGKGGQGVVRQQRSTDTSLARCTPAGERQPPPCAGTGHTHPPAWENHSGAAGSRAENGEHSKHGGQKHAREATSTATGVCRRTPLGLRNSHVTRDLSSRLLWRHTGKFGLQRGSDANKPQG